MCAIAGTIGINTDRNTIEAMLETMKRRGPDDNGFFRQEDCCLLHSRLTVIDPIGGSQPMHLQWGSEKYTIVYNGELYNTMEIRELLLKLGHNFTGYSDTEVVLHAYVQWGEGCLDRFNGIFAFGVWDHKRRKLFLARDRMGVKPLFYKIFDKGIVFASEIKTLLAHPKVEAQLDRHGIMQLIMLGPGREPGSGVFKDIYELKPGCFGYFYNGKWTWKCYWRLKDREHTENFEQTAEHVKYLVTDAIKRQMISDVPIGTFLSGGLDSSLISSVCAGKMKDNCEQLKTFSLEYEKNDQYFIPGKFQPDADTVYIKIMEEYLKSDQHCTVIKTGELAEALKQCTIARDLPGMADVDASLLLFCKQIRNHVKVALSGECADEIFGGYPWYRDPEIRELECFPWAQNSNIRASFLHPAVRDEMNAQEYVRTLYEDTVNCSDILPDTVGVDRRMKEMVNLNHYWFMQTLLDRKDRMSMFTGLEVRVPFCDYRIAEYLYSVPWEFKDYKGREKGLLRYAMSEYLPDTVLYRKKSPYPKTYDPAYFSKVSQMLKELLKNNNAPLLQIIDKAALINLLDAEYAWPWYGQLMKVPQTIAYMLQINYWMEEYRICVV